MSREAFEAWLGIKPCGAAHDLSWKAWQAAIQHACDVAAEIVLRELDDNGQARAINDAIKETLK
jgi:hypothetical protein